MTFKDIEPDFNIELQFPMPIISNIEASSTLKNDSYYYGTDNLYDNDKNTAWVEGVDGDGENEHLFIWISESAGDYTTRAVSKIGLINGYTKDYTTFMNNNRIKKAKLEISDIFNNVNEKIIHLDDTQEIQYIYLDKPILTQYIKLTILEIYKGNKYSDTCLSEIIVFTDEL